MLLPRSFTHQAFDSVQIERLRQPTCKPDLGWARGGSTAAVQSTIVVESVRLHSSLRNTPVPSLA
jgi:hypothetical protein